MTATRMVSFAPRARPVPRITAGAATVDARKSRLFIQSSKDVTLARLRVTRNRIGLPVQDHLAGLARAHHLKSLLEFGERKMMRNHGPDVEAALQHDGHLIPGLVHFAAVDALN